MPGASPRSHDASGGRAGKFQNGVIVTVALRAPPPFLAISEPAPFTRQPNGGTSNPPIHVEDSLLKRRTHTYTRKYQPAYARRIYTPPPIVQYGMEAVGCWADMPLASGRETGSQ